MTFLLFIHFLLLKSKYQINQRRFYNFILTENRALTGLN